MKKRDLIGLIMSSPGRNRKGCVPIICPGFSYVVCGGVPGAKEKIVYQKPFRANIKKDKAGNWRIVNYLKYPKLPKCFRDPCNWRLKRDKFIAEVGRRREKARGVIFSDAPFFEISNENKTLEI